jgi:hypothetical protein
LSYLLGIEEKRRSPRLTLPKTPLPLLFFDHPAAIDPQCETPPC